MPPGSVTDLVSRPTRAENGNNHLGLDSILSMNTTQPLPRQPILRTPPDTQCSRPPMPSQGRRRTPTHMPSPGGNIQVTQLHSRMPADTHSQRLRMYTEPRHPRLRMATQPQGILATLIINIWYIAKPRTVASQLQATTSPQTGAVSGSLQSVHFSTLTDSSTRVPFTAANPAAAAV